MEDEREQGEAVESALAGVGVPGLSKPCRPGTVRGRRERSGRGGRRECSGKGQCARSVKIVQTWNGE